MNILCSICARGGSDTLKNKNIKKLYGRPLIVHTLITAKKTKIFDNIVVSSDSKKIIDISKKYVDYTIKRPSSLSRNNSPKVPAIRHALINSEKFFKKKFDIIIDLDATSPLRTTKDIKGALNTFLKNRNSNLLSVCKSNKNPYFNMVEKKKRKIKIVKNSKINFYTRQDAPEIFDINASIYIWKRYNLLKMNNIINKKTGIFIMPKSRSIDIDDYYDFELVKYFFKKNKNI
ncbi:MAG: acylneuraminate cytidylyltransferase family protein [Pelagibacteraceae bacterium]|jgi:CMP-N,N'-diacetyllegionaminic acid synthase|nr:acylneuraminate cytidylyltransferase family protein [Pelagibacteraceae bacterium]